MAVKKQKTREEIAEAEYNRLVSRYKEANVDEIRLQVNDSLIRKVAELYAILESIKDLPTLYFGKLNPYAQKETAAGKARVKYMAQYTSAMQKLNKEMLGAIASDDDGGLDDYE